MIERSQTGPAIGPAAGVGADEPPELETVMHLMWDRIEGLEAEKRAFKRYLAWGIAILLLGTATLGAISWTRADRTELARDLVLKDAGGRIRARLDVDAATGATTLQLIDQNGHPQAMLAAAAAGPALTFYGRDGKPRLRMGLASESPMVEVGDAKGARMTRVDLTAPGTAAVDDGSLRNPPRQRGASPRMVFSPRRSCDAGALGCRGRMARAQFGGRG